MENFHDALLPVRPHPSCRCLSAMLVRWSASMLVTFTVRKQDDAQSRQQRLLPSNHVLDTIRGWLAGMSRSNAISRVP